jgi:ATP-dependent DNA helicase RecG
LSDQDFYTTAGLYRRDLATGDQGFTMAALLLFGKEGVIQSGIPHYKIDALVRRINIDRYDDRVNIRCNLIEAYDKLMDFVAKHLPDKFYMEGDQRISLREKIFREIVANMLIHREYTNAFPTSLIIYQHKLETKNANKPHLYGQLRPDTFEPFPKNPHLAQLFTQMGRSEELGTGLRNVFKYSKAYSGSDKVSFLEEDFFVVNVPLTNDVTENVTENVTKNRSSSIVTEIKLNNNISIDQLAEKLKVSKRTIIRDIEKLKKQNKIARIGPVKGGHWEVGPGSAGR